MRNHDPEWNQAANLAEAGTFTARWYDEQLAGFDPVLGNRTMMQALAELNRRGVVCFDSQDGPDTHPESANFVHRAYACLLVPTSRKVFLEELEALTSQHLIVITHRPRLPKKDDYTDALPVVLRGGEPTHSVGAHLSRATLAEVLDPFGPAVLDEAAACLQVTLIDSIPDRDTMWPLLHNLAVSALPQD